jgi:hypothetical protein
MMMDEEKRGQFQKRLAGVDVLRHGILDINPGIVFFNE